MLVAPGRDAAVTVKCEPEDAQVHARLKLLDAGGKLLVVVNASEQSARARLDSPALKGVTRLPVLGHGEAAEVREGALSVELSAIGVRVYWLK